MSSILPDVSSALLWPVEEDGRPPMVLRANNVALVTTRGEEVPVSRSASGEEIVILGTGLKKW